MPLYHWLMAGVVKVAGYHVWLLRLFSSVFTYAAVVVLFRLLVRRGLQEWPACALALLFGLSPYVFGVSFLAMTDALALLFLLLAVARLDRFARTRESPDFAVFLLWLCAAVLTRQSAVWLAVAGIGVVALTTRAWRPVALATVGAAVALAPFGLLAATWGGLVPRGSDPTSCGLCRSGDASAALSVRPALFTVALVGIYATAVLGPSLPGQAERLRPLLVSSLAAGAGGFALLAVVPMQRSGERDAGYLWKLASYEPGIAGSGGLFWLLVPLGAGLGILLARRAWPDALPTLLGLAFLASTLVVRLPYQKYFDPFVLPFVLLAVRSEPDLRRPWQWLGAGSLAVAFVAYVFTF